MWAMHLAPWTFFAVSYFYAGLITKSFGFSPQTFTWGFDKSTSYGYFLHWYNTVFNATCAAIEMLFNVLSLVYVHQSRKSIQNVATTENQRREIKLLIQCFILGLIFTMTNILFTIVLTMGWKTPAVLLCMQFTWTSNHCVNPVVYLSINKRLRQKLLKLFSWRGCDILNKNAVIPLSPGPKLALHDQCKGGC